MAYKTFFGLKDTPFRLSPDPDYYFPSDVHKEALHNLLYSIRAGEGFVQITGDPGTGKTLILRTLLKQLGDEVNTALILNPRLSPQELLKVILEDLGLDLAEMQKKPKEGLLRSFREFLLDKAGEGINTVIIIDEAQNLPNETLEELRLLSNLETEKKKLLQIILVGQLELEGKLQDPGLKQLNQRITIRYRLRPLSKNDTIAYIHHRLRIAGGDTDTRFSPRVLTSVYKLSRGIPRIINLICERALMAAFVEEKKTIEKSHIKKAMVSIEGEKEITRSSWATIRPLTVMLLGLFLFISVIGVGYPFFFPGWIPSLHLSEYRFMSGKRFAGEPKRENLTGKNERLSISREDSEKFPAQITKKVLMPTPPPEVFHVPVGKFFIAVDRGAKTAYIWQGSHPAPILKAEFEWEMSLKEGIFIIGMDVYQRPFIFNHLSFSWNNPYMITGNMWKKAAKYITKDNVVPLIVYSSTRELDPSILDRAQKIMANINSWADAWRSMDLTYYMNFYGNTIATYNLHDIRPHVYSWNEYYSIKRSVFSRSGFISLEISDPICIIDPSNPKIATLIFYQKYASMVYSDKGIKALYFNFPDGLKGKRIWKIVAKLWIPYDS